jgi:hypothetical protein
MSGPGGDRPDPRKRPGGHRVPHSVRFILADPGREPRGRTFSEADLGDAVTALLFAAGATLSQDQQDRYRGLAHKFRGVVNELRTGGEWPPHSGRCYSCGKPV